MPWAPTPHCTRPGCPNRTTHGLCNHHAAQAQADHDQRRGTSRQRGYTHTWDQIRDNYLERHPICDHCGNTATIAHHTTRRTLLVAMNIPNPDDDRYLQPLCTTCHGRLHATEGDRFT